MARDRVVIFWVAAGARTGFGHLRRCLTLAGALRQALAVRFVVRDSAGARLVEEAGFTATTDVDGWLRDARDVDGVLVDDYDCTPELLQRIKTVTRRLVVVDDLADRPLEIADAVVNGSPGAESLPYRVRPDCVRLFGPSYALLPPVFAGMPRRALADRVHRVLVTLGGSDPHGDTPAVVATVERSLPEAEIDVVIGPLFGEASRVEASRRVRVHPPQPDLSSLMLACDLAVTGGGQTTYELAAAGVPAVALALADNQRHNLRALADAPTLVSVPRGDVAVLADAVARLATDLALRQKMSATGQRLFDGRGVERAAAAIVDVCRDGGAHHG